MKKILKILIVAALTLTLAASSFAAYAAEDAAEDSRFTARADALFDMGLFLGTDSGYDLDKIPTRAQAAVMLVRFLGKEAEAKTLEWTAPFTDVPDWAKPYVQYLYIAGLTAGYSDTIYAPDDNCSAQMYATFMLRALGYRDIEIKTEDVYEEGPVNGRTDEFDHIEFIGHGDWDSEYRIPPEMFDTLRNIKGEVELGFVSIDIGSYGGIIQADHWVDFVAAEGERHGVEAEWGMRIYAEDRDCDGIKEHYLKIACSGLFGCPEHGGWKDDVSQKIIWDGTDGKKHELPFSMKVSWPWVGSSASDKFVPDFSYADALGFAAEKGLTDEENCDAADFQRGHMVAVAYRALSLPTADGAYRSLAAKLAAEGVITAAQARRAIREDYFADLKDLVITCVGDSITYGYGINDPAKDSYPSVLGRLLGEGNTVYNFGVSGATMMNKDSHSYTAMTEYSDSLRSSPDIIIIMLGTNDSVYIRNLGFSVDDFISVGREMLKAYTGLESQPEIYIACPPHAFKGRTDVELYVEAYIRPAVEKLADEFGVNYIDMWKYTEDMDRVFPDGIHPSVEGYSMLAEIFYKIITG